MGLALGFLLSQLLPALDLHLGGLCLLLGKLLDLDQLLLLLILDLENWGLQPLHGLHLLLDRPELKLGLSNLRQSLMLHVWRYRWRLVCWQVRF